MGQVYLYAPFFILHKITQIWKELHKIVQKYKSLHEIVKVCTKLHRFYAIMVMSKSIRHGGGKPSKRDTVPV